MPRIRTVKPEFLKHYDLYALDKEHNLPIRLSFLGLWICADKEGRFKWKPQQLKLDALPYDEVDFEKILSILSETGFILKYEVNECVYGCIPTFKVHQRITGSEAHSESKIPEPPRKHIGNTSEAPRQQDGNNLDDRKGREGKGVEEGKGDVPTHFQDDSVTWNAEEDIFKNKIEWERILMSSQKDEKFARDSLRKYHLWLADKDLYPKKRKTIFPGFEKWLSEEKYSKNGTNKQLASRSDKSENGVNHAIATGTEALAKLAARGKQDG